jgi:hypothetical protein
MKIQYQRIEITTHSLSIVYTRTATFFAVVGIGFMVPSPQYLLNSMSKATACHRKKKS